MESTDLPTGQLVDGRYSIVRVLGEGGMGTVYLADDTRSGHRQVALKVIHPIFADRPDRQKRFAMEVAYSALSGRLPRHPNIATTLDSDVDPSAGAFIVMEYIKGPALGGLGMYRDALEPAEIYPLALDVARGLSEVHRAGLVHRDLTPINVLVATVDGQRVAKIIDFSHAASIVGPRLCLGAPGRLTAPTEVLGTPGYMAPEQVQHAYPAPSMDVFAFGVVFWELLADQHAFKERERIPYCHMQTSGPCGPRPLASVRRDLPQEVYALIDACTSVDADARPSAAELVTRLERIVAPPTPAVVEEHGPPSVPRLRHAGDTLVAPLARHPTNGKIVALVAALVLFAVLVAAGLWVVALDRELVVRPSAATSTEPGRSLRPPAERLQAAEPAEDPPSTRTPSVAPEEDKGALPSALPEREPSVDSPDRQPSSRQARPSVVRDSPASEQSPTSGRTKKPNGSTNCAKTLSDAKAASESGRWTRVLKLTKPRACWDASNALLRLRIEALLESGRWAHCVALGRTASDTQAKRVGKRCAQALAAQERQ